jgi:hypothetical protein
MASEFGNAMYVDDSDPFHFSILPIDPFPEDPTLPSSELQREALDDICAQLIC